MKPNDSVSPPNDAGADIPAEALAAARAGEPKAKPVVVALRDGFHPTDGGNADRLLKLHGEHLRHVAVWRKWLVVGRHPLVHRLRRPARARPGPRRRR